MQVLERGPLRQKLKRTQESLREKRKILPRAANYWEEVLKVSWL
jgi:hypothetical protein